MNLGTLLVNYINACRTYIACVNLGKVNIFFYNEKVERQYFQEMLKARNAYISAYKIKTGRALSDEEVPILLNEIVTIYSPFV